MANMISALYSKMNVHIPSMYVGDLSLRSLGSALNNSFARKQTDSKHLVQTE